jgi:RND family efflux transporter MFP subunit
MVLLMKLFLFFKIFKLHHHFCFINTWVLGCCALLLVGCGQGTAQSGLDSAGGPPPVSVAPATQRTVQDFDEFSARLEAADTVEVRSRVSGTLQQVHFKEGQLVKKGALLFTIDTRPFAAELARAQAQLGAVQTQAELSASEVARAEKLLPLQAISAQELDQLKASARSAQANVKAAQAALQTAQLNLGYARVVSHINGRVSRANVTVGNLVGVSDPVLTTIVSTSKMYAYFDVSEATYLRSLRSANAAGAVTMGLANEEGFPHKGALDFVDNRLNPATGSIRARAVFDNQDNQFTPGLSARIRLTGSGNYAAVLVPERAISTDQTRKVVMVVGANNIVQPREVKLGSLFDGMRVITGIKAGENVIVDGLQRAFPGAPVSAQVLKVDANGMPIMPQPGQSTPAAEQKGEQQPASAADKK